MKCYCEECKKTFKNKKSLSNHLRYGCGGSDDIMLICKICDKEFLRPKSNLNQEKRGQYCSKVCRSKAHSLNMAGKGHPNYGKHASKKTRKKMRDNHADFKGINHPQYGKKRSRKTKQKISSARMNISLDKMGHFKDCQCFICKAKRGEFKGKLHPCYIDGLSLTKYTKEFNAKLKLIILKRDNFRCSLCKTTNKKHKEIYKGMSLTIHHIDYNKKNCKDKNLITLCVSCNFKVNYKRKYWKKYFRGLINAI